LSVDRQRNDERPALAGLIADLPEGLRQEALTHTSWTSAGDSYERLAYLGDSVLGLAVAASLFDRFRDVDAGGLTKVHNQVVSGVSCAEVGLDLGVPEMLEAAQPEYEDAIPAAALLEAGSRPLPEVTEALIGACFLTFGFDRTAVAVVEAFESKIEYAVEAGRAIDAKSTLQELLARRRARVSYEVIAEAGPPHRRTFEVAAIVDSEQVGRGSGKSKKQAEKAAAEQALEKLEAE
jgi:ribonuclease III